jgi:hypothetical protein
MAASGSMGNQQAGQSTLPSTNTQGNSTINIYPQNNNTVNVVPPANGNTNGNSAAGQVLQGNYMPNMGTSYDENKMEKLHSGLYKISLGMALLGQLDNDLVNQAEYVNTDAQYPVQYYSDQYYQTVQNKNKLYQASTYINEAVDLININPYVSSNGLVYDKDRMNQIHQSVFKLAAAVSEISLLNDDFTKQAINLSNTVQNYINNQNASSMNNMNMSMPTNPLSGLFGNISLPSIVNILLILFAVGLVFGIIGYIYSLFKSSNKRTEMK